MEWLVCTTVCLVQASDQVFAFSAAPPARLRRRDDRLDSEDVSTVIKVCVCCYRAYRFQFSASSYSSPPVSSDKPETGSEPVFV